MVPTDLVGQTLIFVIIVVLLGALFFFAYRPFVSRMHKEVCKLFDNGPRPKSIKWTQVRRATIVLAGLPDYVDLNALTK